MPAWALGLLAVIGGAALVWAMIKLGSITLDDDEIREPDVSHPPQDRVPTTISVLPAPVDQSCPCGPPGPCMTRLPVDRVSKTDLTEKAKHKHKAEVDRAFDHSGLLSPNESFSSMAVIGYAALNVDPSEATPAQSHSVESVTPKHPVPVFAPDIKTVGHGHDDKPVVPAIRPEGTSAPRHESHHSTPAWTTHHEPSHRNDPAPSNNHSSPHSSSSHHDSSSHQDSPSSYDLGSSDSGSWD